MKYNSKIRYRRLRHAKEDRQSFGFHNVRAHYRNGYYVRSYARRNSFYGADDVLGYIIIAIFLAAITFLTLSFVIRNLHIFLPIFILSYLAVIFFKKNRKSIKVFLSLIKLKFFEPFKQFNIRLIYEILPIEDLNFNLDLPKNSELVITNEVGYLNFSLGRGLDSENCFYFGGRTGSNKVFVKAGMKTFLFIDSVSNSLPKFPKSMGAKVKIVEIVFVDQGKLLLQSHSSKLS